MTVFTPDKEALRENIRPAGDRELAVDLKKPETDATARTRVPDWWRREREVLEQHRRHTLFMERLRTNKQKIVI